MLKPEEGESCMLTRIQEVRFVHSPRTHGGHAFCLLDLFILVVTYDVTRSAQDMTMVDRGEQKEPPYGLSQNVAFHVTHSQPA